MRKKSAARLVELALLYQLIFSVGLASLLAFVGYTFYPEEVAKALSWNLCPFQNEVANADLGYVALAITSIWLRGHFWTAIVIGRSVWLLGDAVNHLYQRFGLRNMSEGNIGIPFYLDIVIPLTLIILVSFYNRLRKKS